jgi:hypothetical protein
MNLQKPQELRNSSTTKIEKNNKEGTSPIVDTVVPNQNCTNYGVFLALLLKKHCTI